MIQSSLYFVVGVLTLAQFVTIFFTSYQIVMGVGMFLRRKDRRVKNNQLHKFALLVCAHNEERVVGQIVDNLHTLEYPADHYDVYVICDNCSDNTAGVVRDHGGIAMERFDLANKGKGFGLEWMFKKLWDLEEHGTVYDAVLIFDADNLVSRNFLTEMNKKLNAGYEVVQGYLDSKNPNDTWITKSYAYAYWTTNRLYQLAHSQLGLSAQLGGTGFMVTTQILKKLGWGATSLTEDLEFTVRYVLATNGAVGWADRAKIYDEKPLRMKASFVQRIRWMKGHFNCAFRYSIPLIQQFLKKPSLRTFDVLVYLNQPYRAVLSANVLGFYLLSLFIPMPSFVSGWVVHFWVWTGIIILALLQAVVALFLERKWAGLSWFVWSFFFAISWIPVIAIAFFKRNDHTWTHTQHVRDISMADMKA